MGNGMERNCIVEMRKKQAVSMVCINLHPEYSRNPSNSLSAAFQEKERIDFYYFPFFLEI